MGNKISPIVIIVLLVLVIAIGFFAFTIITSKSNPADENNAEAEARLIRPTLELSLDTYEENQEKVIITANASTTDENGISSIILPDSTEILADEASFEVTENGEYTFQVLAANGRDFTKSITVSNIREVSSSNPYIPNGFSHLEGTTIEDGYIIEDGSGNQYVWVPVESGKLTRNTMLNNDYEETSSTASGLVNSVAQNYGFYIGRYEASEVDVNGQKVAGSMEGKMPWTNITYLDAADFATASARVFGYDEEYNTAIVNSYAWDTLLGWLDQRVVNYSSNTNYGNYSGSVYPTGTTQTDIINNVCDVAGNVREWTTEIYKKDTETTNNKNNKEENILKRIVRGGSANLSRTPASHIPYSENTFDAYWGFRLILYK